MSTKYMIGENFEMPILPNRQMRSIVYLFYLYKLCSGGMWYFLFVFLKMLLYSQPAI